MTYVIQIEGNIGAGKTTFIKYLHDKLKLKSIETIYEPIEEWKDMKGYDLFKLYYNDKTQYAELFQTYVLLTTLKKHLLSNFSHKDNCIIICERSILANVYCFAQYLLNINEIRVEFFQMCCDILEKYKSDIIQPDLIIYLKTENINILHSRIKQRNRDSESNISLKYLQDLNQIYDQYIKTFQCPIIKVDINEMDHDNIFQSILDHIRGAR